MGLSTPPAPDPHGECTEAQADCRRMPTGIQAALGDEEVPGDLLDLVVFYAANLAVPERFADSIFEGQEAEILISGTSHRLRGEVRYIAAAIDEATRTLRIEVLTPNPDGALRAGHFARARLNLGGEREVIRVPKDALSERAGVYRLYVRGEDNRAIASLVTVIESDGDEFLIDASELPDRVELILSPPRMLQDGSPITASMEG